LRTSPLTGTATTIDWYRFSLMPSPPFRLGLTVWALRRRPENALDRWAGETYRRVLLLADGAVELAARQTGSAERPRIEFRAATKPAVTAAFERMLGLRTDMTQVYRFASSQRRLDQLAAKFRGMKPPRFPTLFEALINAIAC
jgi:DNA-3-methyladenine glycosylase II